MNGDEERRSQPQALDPLRLMVRQEDGSLLPLFSLAPDVSGNGNADARLHGRIQNLAPQPHTIEALCYAGAPTVYYMEASDDHTSPAPKLVVDIRRVERSADPQACAEFNALMQTYVALTSDAALFLAGAVHLYDSIFVVQTNQRWVTVTHPQKVIDFRPVRYALAKLGQVRVIGGACLAQPHTFLYVVPSLCLSFDQDARRAVKEALLDAWMWSWRNSTIAANA